MRDVVVPDPDTFLDVVLRDAEPRELAPQQPAALFPVRQWRDWWSAAGDSSSAAITVAKSQGFVLTPADCAALGVSRARSRNEVEQGRWTDAGRGAVAPVDVRRRDSGPGMAARVRRRRHAVNCAGASMRRSGAVSTGRSAAILSGLPTRRIPETPELTEREVGDGVRTATHVFSARLPRSELAEWYGIPVESPARTLVTLARHGRWDALMAADAALREGLVDRDDVRRALDTAIGWPYVRRARAVLALADPLSESPLESITRLRLHDSGFPDPELQVWFGYDRVDFWWRKYGLVVEADGDVKYVGDASLTEKRRERRLLRHADVRRVERLGWWDVTANWPSTARDLRANFT